MYGLNILETLGSDQFALQLTGRTDIAVSQRAKLIETQSIGATVCTDASVSSGGFLIMATL